MTDTFLFRLLVTQAWQIAVVTVIVAVAAKFLTARRPQLAHWLWLIVVLKCVTPPLWGHQLGLFSNLQSLMPAVANTDITTVGLDEASWPVVDAERMSSDIAFSVGHSFPVGTTIVSNGASESFGQDESGIAAFVPPSTGHKFLWLVLSIGMLTSLVLLTCRFLSCLRRIHQKRVTEFDSEIGSLVADLSRKLNLRRVPRVIVSDVRFGPAVLGIFRHLIVLPKCLVADAACRTEKSLRPILAHELMHIRRGDLLTGTLQAAVQCLWWFHPAVWFANRLLSRETERCCDEQVVAELGCSPVEYARSLLAVIECKQNLKPVPVFPGMKPVEITSQRMERIMSLTQGSRTRTPWSSVVAVMLFAVAVLPGAVVGQQVVESPAAEEVYPNTEALRTPETALDEREVLSGFGMLDVITLSAVMEPQEMATILKTVQRNGFSGTTLVAVVNGEPVFVDDLVGSMRLTLEANPAITLEEKTRILHEQLKRRMDTFIEQEIILQAMGATIAADVLVTVDESLEEAFQRVIASIKSDRRVTSDQALEELLAEDGLTIGVLRRDFIRIQKVQGYLSTLVDMTLPLERRIQKRKSRVDDLRAKATVVTIFDGEANAEKQTANDHADENTVITYLKASATGESLIGKGVESDAGVTGKVVLDKPSVRVLGAVACPGVYESPRDGDFKLMDALALAGGFVEPVDGSLILRRRMGTGDTSIRLLRIDNMARGGGSNLVLCNGDVIVVAKGKTKFNLEQEMEDALSRRISISFKDVPCQVVLRKIAKEGGLNIMLDTRAVETAGVVVDKKVSLEMKDAEVRKVLDVFCLQLDLAYDIQVDCVRITNSESAGKGPASGVRGGPGPLSIRGANNGWNPELPSHAWPAFANSSQVAEERAAALDRDFVVAVVRKLARQFSANIVMKADTLQGLKIPRRDQLTVNFDNVELTAALDEFCGQLGLEYTTGKEVIRIHRRMRFSPTVYSVADLVMPHTQNSKTAKLAVTDGAVFEPLIELIKTTVEPGTWSATSGRIVPDKNTCSLVIRQADEVHGQIVDLLSQLRQLQALKIVTNVVVCRFKTQEQLGRLGRAVEFRNRSEGLQWALMPRAESVTSLFDPSENEGPVSSSEIAAFVGQAANINLQIPGLTPLRVSLVGVPLAEDKFIRLSYSIDFDGPVVTAPPLQATYQVVANGQTLLLDVTDAVLRSQVDADYPGLTEGDSDESDVTRREKVKLATQIQANKTGRIVVAITTSVDRRVEAEMKSGRSNQLQK